MWDKGQIEAAKTRAALAAEVTLKGDDFRDLLDTVAAYLEVLAIARDAMSERRGYAEAWEWKYGEAWDEEDMKVRDALIA